MNKIGYFETEKRLIYTRQYVNISLSTHATLGSILQSSQDANKMEQEKETVTNSIELVNKSTEVTNETETEEKPAAVKTETTENPAIINGEHEVEMAKISEEATANHTEIQKPEASTVTTNETKTTENPATVTESIFDLNHEKTTDKPHDNEVSAPTDHWFDFISGKNYKAVRARLSELDMGFAGKMETTGLVTAIKKRTVCIEPITYKDLGMIMTPERLDKCLNSELNFTRNNIDCPGKVKGSAYLFFMKEADAVEAVAEIPNLITGITAELGKMKPNPNSRRVFTLQKRHLNHGDFVNFNAILPKNRDMVTLFCSSLPEDSTFEQLHDMFPTSWLIHISTEPSPHALVMFWTEDELKEAVKELEGRESPPTGITKIHACTLINAKFTGRHDQRTKKKRGARGLKHKTGQEGQTVAAETPAADGQKSLFEKAGESSSLKRPREDSVGNEEESVLNGEAPVQEGGGPPVKLSKGARKRLKKAKATHAAAVVHNAGNPANPGTSGQTTSQTGTSAKSQPSVPKNQPSKKQQKRLKRQAQGGSDGGGRNNPQQNYGGSQPRNNQQDYMDQSMMLLKTLTTVAAQLTSGSGGGQLMSGGGGQLMSGGSGQLMSGGSEQLMGGGGMDGPKQRGKGGGRGRGRGKGKGRQNQGQGQSQGQGQGQGQGRYWNQDQGQGQQSSWQNDYERDTQYAPQNDFQTGTQYSPQNDYQRDTQYTPQNDFQMGSQYSPQNDYQRDAQFSPQGNFSNNYQANMGAPNNKRRARGVRAGRGKGKGRQQTLNAGFFEDRNPFSGGSSLFSNQQFQ